MAGYCHPHHHHHHQCCQWPDHTRTGFFCKWDCNANDVRKGQLRLDLRLSNTLAQWRLITDKRLVTTNFPHSSSMDEKNSASAKNGEEKQSLNFS
jgi:hypothetical protein